MGLRLKEKRSKHNSFRGIISVFAFPVCIGEGQKVKVICLRVNGAKKDENTDDDVIVTSARPQ